MPAVNTPEDEAAAMAAMFQAQTANWEEAQEKMSQLVSRIRAVFCRVVHFLMNFVLPFPCWVHLPSPVVVLRGYTPTPAARLEVASRFSRHLTKTALSHPAMSVIAVDRKVRCHHVPAFEAACSDFLFQGHWIQDCPTNNDREFDNRPRIKRTTGIPRSFLKAVDNPTTGQLSAGVMVTPEGGYVVAQPDSCAVSPSSHTSAPDTAPHLLAAPHGRNKSRGTKGSPRRTCAIARRRTRRSRARSTGSSCATR